ncbi:MAG: hypothetical protein ACK4K7_03115 [Allosphingosinicella sp.]|uniref:hypothetical protein n=1 Tax=Allosphingosinicella sp. TaxID=2823234 RepID=UPI00394CC59B
MSRRSSPSFTTPESACALDREAIRAERDIEVAAWLDGYAYMMEAPPRPREKWEAPVNRVDHPPEVKGPLIVALRGLASSIRAGLVDDGTGACGAGAGGEDGTGLLDDEVAAGGELGRAA